MTREKFSRLVDVLERRYARRPRALKVVILLWAAAGLSGFALLIGGLLLAGLATMVDGALATSHQAPVRIIIGSLLTVYGLWIALRYLWIDSGDLEDVHELKPPDAPALFQAVEALRRPLRASRVHRVVLSTQLNAAMLQQARFGFFGPMRNTLILGLPLLETQTPDEVRAIIAHELGHLSGADGRSGGWIYRLRRAWGRLVENLSTNRARKRFRILEKFLDWYWPRFNARAFVLCRAQEYRADKVAARLTSPEDIAGGLLRLRVDFQRLDEDFWPAFWRRARTEDTPPADAVRSISAWLQTPADPARSAARVVSAFRALTTTDDTHPALTDRWASLGLGPAAGQVRLPDAPPAAGHTAAEEFLGTALPALREELDRIGRREMARRWSAEREWAEVNSDTAAAHAAWPESWSAAGIERLWERARSCLALGEDERGVALLREILLARPGHSRASLALAEHLLAKDDPDGEALAREVLENDDRLCWPAADCLRGYYARTGRREELHALERDLDLRQKHHAGLEKALGEVRMSDGFAAPGLPDDEVLSLRRALHWAGVPEAWLVRKLVPGTSRALYVLRLRNPEPFGGFGKAIARVRKLAAAATVPGRLYAFTPATGGRLLAWRVKRQGLHLTPASPLPPPPPPAAG